MTFWFKPVPRSISRPLSFAVMVAWIAVMAVLVHRSYAQGTGNLATDLARYGSSAQWRGVYYRGEKLGFTVSQTVPFDGDEAVQTTTGSSCRKTGSCRWRCSARTPSPRCARPRASTERSSCSRSSSRSIRAPARSRLAAIVRDRDLHHLDHERRAARAPKCAGSPSARCCRSTSCGVSRTKGWRRARVHQWNVFDPATLRNAPVDGEGGRARNRALGEQRRYPRFASRWSSPA